MEEINFDDIELDGNAMLENKISALEHQQKVIAARLSFPAYVQTGLAGYKIAEHYMGKGLPAILGGIAGYFVTRKKELSQTDRQILMEKLKAIQYEINKLAKQQEVGDRAVTGIMSSQDLQDYDYPKYKFKGRWKDFMGQPSRNCHYMIFGLPKSGKSTFAMHFAKYLADTFGQVLYVAAEEGFSSTLQNKVKAFGLNSDRIHFSNFRDAQNIKNLLDTGEFDFVFIDSVNYIKISPEEIEEIKAEHPNLSIITIQQATKDGSYKGDTAYAHNCDSIIVVEGGIATQKGRFQEESRIQVFPESNRQNEVIGYADVE